MAVMVLLTPPACLAQGTVYSSRSAFLSSLTSSTTITFEELDPYTWGGMSATVSGVSFTGDNLVLSSYFPPRGTNAYLWNFDSSIPVTVSLPAGVTAFGADFSGGIDFFPTFNGTVTLNMVGGSSYSYGSSAPYGQWTFFGINCAQPIASVVYSDGGKPFPDGPMHEEMLDNITFGPAIPEPSAWLLISCSLMALLCRRRLRSGR